MANMEQHLLLIPWCRERPEPMIFNTSLWSPSKEFQEPWLGMMTMSQVSNRYPNVNLILRGCGGGVAPRWAEVKQLLLLPHQNLHPILSTLCHEGSIFLYPFHVGLGYVTCFGQWNVYRHDIWQIWIEASNELTWFGLISCTPAIYHEKHTQGSHCPLSVGLWMRLAM